MNCLQYISYRKVLSLILFFVLYSVFVIAQNNVFFAKVIGIIDGDTIKALYAGQSITIRLNGIDSPEKSQAFGSRAKTYCSSLCFNSIVTVSIFDTDQYGRFIADIFLPDGRIVNQEMVKAGLAWHYKAYSSDPVLASLELYARQTRVGLWTDPNPMPPWDYRKIK